MEVTNMTDDKKDQCNRQCEYSQTLLCKMADDFTLKH